MAQLRAFIEENGAAALAIDYLTVDDLSRIGWSGSPAHVRSVAEKLKAAEHGEVEYLAVRAPDGSPIAKCVVEYSTSESIGEIAQLAVRDDLQGLGIGTRLIREAEVRVRERRMRWAVLGVEAGDERPRALYERLGYELFGRRDASWEVESDDGMVSMYEADVLLLRREVAS